MMRDGPIVHVVQHLQPGELEVMALELVRTQAPSHPTGLLPHPSHRPVAVRRGLAGLSGVRRRIHTENDAWHLNDNRRRHIARLALAAARPILVADAPHVADAVAAALGRESPSVILNGVDVAIKAWRACVIPPCSPSPPPDRVSRRCAPWLLNMASLIGYVLGPYRYDVGVLRGHRRAVSFVPP